MSHPVEHSVNLRDHVSSIDVGGCTFRGTKSHMQGGPLFRDVYSLASEHRINSALQTGFFRQRNQ